MIVKSQIYVQFQVPNSKSKEKEERNWDWGRIL